MKKASIKIPARPGGRELALTLQAANQPSCYVHNPHVGQMSYVLEKQGGDPLVISKADYENNQQGFISIAWRALAMLVVDGIVAEHSDEKLVIQAVEVKDGR